MAEILLLVSAWVFCGLLAAGFGNAFYLAEFPRQSSRERRQDWAFNVGFGLAAGPIALIVVLISTGLGGDGWTLRQHLPKVPHG